MRNQQRGRAYGATLQNWLATDPIDPICAYFVCITYVCDRVTIFNGCTIARKADKAAVI